jgi:hypothetical protein
MVALLAVEAVGAATVLHLALTLEATVALELEAK